MSEDLLEPLALERVKVYRIAAARYAPDAPSLFSGMGGLYYAARWNSVGTRMAYTAESLAQAMLELYVHVQDSPPWPQWVYGSAEIPLECTLTLPLEELAGGWDGHPPGAWTRAYGDRWALEGRSVALAVPSVIVPGGVNYLLSPMHPDFIRVTLGEVTPFRFDARLER